jgi:hypothetical protein
MPRPISAAVLWAAAAAPLLIACAGAGAAADPPRLPEGGWGGNHVAMEVRGGKATLDFDCAHGSIEGPMTVEADGSFDWRGAYVREHGGPIRKGEESAPGEPARYRGRLEGDTLSLEIVPEGSDKAVGTFALKLGQAGRVHKCL